MTSAKKGGVNKVEGGIYEAEPNIHMERKLFIVATSQNFAASSKENS